MSKYCTCFCRSSPSSFLFSKLITMCFPVFRFCSCCTSMPRGMPYLKSLHRRKSECFCQKYKSPPPIFHDSENQSNQQHLRPSNQERMRQTTLTVYQKVCVGYILARLSIRACKCFVYRAVFNLVSNVIRQLPVRLTLVLLFLSRHSVENCSKLRVLIICQNLSFYSCVIVDKDNRCPLCNKLLIR